MKTVAQTDQDAIVASLLVPMQQKNLLVPNVSIAEVVPRSELEQADNAPPWHLGHLHWRGERVPVISFEIANSQVRGQDVRDARIAVFNAVSARPLRAPWVELKYSKTVKPSLKFEIIGVSIISPEGFAIKPRIPAS